MKKDEFNQGLPSWHRKTQKAYKINRVVVILQMVAALALTGVILYGMMKLS